MMLLVTNGWAVTTLTGVAFSMAALASTIAATVTGRLAVRLGPLPIIRFTLPLAAIVVLGFAMVTAGWQFAALRALFGFLMGSTLTLSYTLGSKLLPERWLGVGYGFITSAAQLGGAISLFTTGAIATVDLHIVFYIDFVLLCTALMILMFRLRPRMAAQPAPRVDVSPV